LAGVSFSMSESDLSSFNTSKSAYFFDLYKQVRLFGLVGMYQSFFFLNPWFFPFYDFKHHEIFDRE
jgi:hypothetical protein